MAVETDRQLIESGIALAQGLLTAHNSLSHNASLCSQLEKTMHIRKLSLATHTHTRTHTHTHTHSHILAASNHISITALEVVRKMSRSIYHHIVLRWKMCM